MNKTVEMQNSHPLPEQPQSCIGILLADPTNRRLIEAISAQLDLRPIILSEEDVPSQLDSMEILIADESIALKLHPLLSDRREWNDSIDPALIAVIPNGKGRLESEHFEGLLFLPQTPAIILAQLSVMVYAHRAYARRYRSALDELNLNRRIFRSVTSGISIADASHPNFPLVYVNPSFEAMTGYTLEEIQGANCRFLQGQDREQPGLILVREALKAGRDVTAVLRNYKKNGEAFWNELSLSPIRDHEGKITHFAGIQNDVTARVEIETALLQSEKLAAVGRLAASIAHEINNPLAAVTNLLYLARRESAEEEKDRLLDQAEDEVKRVSLITSQSLRFYKQSSHPQAVRPVDLITATLGMHTAQLLIYGITVEQRDRMKESIVCMDNEVRQVLNNLISNAKDSMRRNGGGRLFIRTREATEWTTDARGVVITIADTGCGMSSETLEKLFTAFYTTKGILATGLGLWISMEIVKRHHGKLLVRSRNDGSRTGSVFQLFLPYQAFVQES